MTKALVSFGVGEAKECIDIARPFFTAYAARYGYAYLEADSIPDGRPASWFKVQELLKALARYDEALWLDADVVIVDGSEDIAAHVPYDAWQALVKHHIKTRYKDLGEVPNSGVWFIRRWMGPYLVQLWNMASYIDHSWWEQAALMEMMGYNPNTQPVDFIGPTAVYRHTHWLPLEWNSHRRDESQNPRFAHASPKNGRMKAMEKLAEQARVYWSMDA
jgi:hypothetical protein